MSSASVPKSQTHYQQQVQNTSLNQIQVPDDYNQDFSPDNLIKEKFFESLGLPPDLSHNSIQNFQYNPQQQQFNNDLHNMGSRSNTEEIESQLFKSCNDQMLSANTRHMVASQQQRMTPTGQQSNLNFNNQMSSQNSYRTAFNGVPTNKGASERILPSYNQQQPDLQQFEQFKNFEQMFMDSSRKASAPTAYRNQNQIGFGEQSSGSNLEDSQKFGVDGRGGQTITSNKELMTITIEIGNGQQAQILIRENDDPYELATIFAQKHGIDEQLTELLAEQIKLNMDSVIQQELESIQNLNNQLANYEQQHQQEVNTMNMPRQQSWGQTFDTQPTKQAYKEGGNQMNIYQNPFYQPQSQHPNHISKNSKSFIDEKGGVSLTNQSFHTERSTYNNYNNLNNQSHLTNGSINPGTTLYKQWQEQVWNKFHTLDDNKQVYPTINENSKRMIESKRSGSASKATGTVHQRLHQQALSKQKTKKQNNDNSFSNNNNTNLGGSGRINRSSFGGMGNSTFGGNAMRSGSAGLGLSGQSTPSKEKGQQQQMVRASSLQNREQQYNSGQMTTMDHSNQISHRRPSQVVNYGERLYQKGLKRKEELERHIRDAKNEQERFNTEQYSFAPQINETSRYLVRPKNERAEDSLINYGKQVKEKIDQMRSEVMHQELDECKFRPAITKKSERIMNDKMYGGNQYDPYRQKPPIVNKFDNLYEDAKRRKERQDKIYSACIESECTFQPDTSDTRYYHSSNSQNRDPNASGNMNGTVYQRLSNHGSRERQQQLERSRGSLHNELFDPETGQQYFKPKVGRAPRNQQRPTPGAGIIGQMLYEHSKELKQKQEDKKRMTEDEKRNKAATVFTQDQTNRIIEKTKIQKFVDIFKQLDSDGDGTISANRIDITALQPELLEVLTPLFVEMEELGQTLDEDEFIDAIGRLYDSVTIPEKNILLQQKQKWDKSKSKMLNDQDMFRPQLNANSMRIAAKKRPNADVAEILIAKKEEYQQKVNEKQQEKENSELIGCTFHPKILQSPSGGGSEVNSSRSKSYNRQAMMMLNHSSHSLRNASNGNGAGSSSAFDINNLAHNIANEVLKKQQAYNTISNNNNNSSHSFLNNTTRAGNLTLKQDQQYGITSGGGQGGGSFTGSSSGTAHVTASGGIRQQLLMNQ